MNSEIMTFRGTTAISPNQRGIVSGQSAIGQRNRLERLAYKERL